MESKLELLRKVMTTSNLDVVISFSEQTRLWLTGVISSMGYLFVDQNNSYLHVDGRYFEYASNVAKNVNVLPLEKVNEFILTKKDLYKRIGVEKDYMTLEELNIVKKFFPESEIIQIDAKKLRSVKTSDEVAKIKKAAMIALTSFDELVKNDIRVGVTEKELDAKLDYYMKINGATKASFDSIVVSGPNGSLPHGKPSERKIEEGDLVTIDFGAYYEGYASDITRTICVGNYIKDEKLREIYEIVKTAQQKGIEAVRPGVSTCEIDNVCREYITSKGYGQYFVHSTGHGLGIDVHEFPSVSKNKNLETILEPGMVITVEPGIYVPNLGGVRIEDDILVTQNGFEILSRL